ncbi:MAG: NAD(P)H-dependent oxidoreductase [Cellulosilyticaceae bacterium]
MPKFGFINGSPRPSGSLSCQLIDYLIQELHLITEDYTIFDARRLTQKEDCSSEYARLLACDTIVVVAPLYVDSLPATLLQFLHQLAHYQSTLSPDKSPILYGLINCGFIDGFQNHLALNILEHYAMRMNWSFGGALGFGSGEMFKATHTAIPKASKIMKPLYEAFDTLITCLASQTTLPTPNKQLLVNQGFSQSLFMTVAGFGWLPQAWAHHVTPCKLFARPFQAPISSKPSP